jgi:hypothetical protein
MLVFLLLLWPGTWSGDDLAILDIIKLYNQWYGWQHWLSGSYWNMLLQILPFPGGGILLQNVIISVCVAFSVIKLEQIFGIGRLKWNWADALVKVIPFLLPPVIMYQFSGYRIGLYIYLELVLLLMFVRGEKKWSFLYLLLFCVLSVIVASWRPESFFYLLCACMVLLLSNKKVIPTAGKLVGIVIIAIGFVKVGNLQNAELGYSDDYKLVCLMNPVVELVRTADVWEDAALLADVDKVINLSILDVYSNRGGLSMYFSVADTVRHGYTEEEFKDFVRAFVKLSIKYPKTVIAERWSVFVQSSGITGETWRNVEKSAILYDEDFADSDKNPLVDVPAWEGWLATEPVSVPIRKGFIWLLGYGSFDGTQNLWNNIWQRLVWNALIPIVILIFAWIRLLIKREWALFGICTAVVIRIPIVILTEPSEAFMYLLSFYLLGYVYLVYSLLAYRSRKKERKV